MIGMADARRLMVEAQIRPYDVPHPAVLAAFSTVPRERFLPQEWQNFAYADHKIEMQDRRLLTPMVLARLMAALSPVAGEYALDVMDVSGYSAALLTTLGLKVTFLERDQTCLEAARQVLLDYAVDFAPAAPNLSFTSTPSLGGGKFDLILINGASEEEPKGFFTLLKEGGRLGVILNQNGRSRAVIYRLERNKIGMQRIFDVEEKTLPGFQKAQTFVF